MKRINLEGKQFGRLNVLKYSHSDVRGLAHWDCICDCGNVVKVVGAHLRSGNTISCGCYNRERCAERLTKHGGRNTRLYSIWKGMRNRCRNTKADCYYRYGGRGIEICSEWDDFTIFRDWCLANGYRDDLTIERKNNDGNYAPDNCEWTTYKRQALNRGMFRNNTSGFTGVVWSKSHGKWCAQIKIDGKQECLGYYADITEAAKARQKAEVSWKAGKK